VGRANIAGQAREARDACPWALRMPRRCNGRAPSLRSRRSRDGLGTGNDMASSWNVFARFLWSTRARGMRGTNVPCDLDVLGTEQVEEVVGGVAAAEIVECQFAAEVAQGLDVVEQRIGDGDVFAFRDLNVMERPSWHAGPNSAPSSRAKSRSLNEDGSRFRNRP